MSDFNFISQIVTRAWPNALQRTLTQDTKYYEVEIEDGRPARVFDLTTVRVVPDAEYDRINESIDATASVGICAIIIVTDGSELSDAVFFQWNAIHPNYLPLALVDDSSFELSADVSDILNAGKTQSLETVFTRLKKGEIRFSGEDVFRQEVFFEFQQVACNECDFPTLWFTGAVSSRGSNKAEIQRWHWQRPRISAETVEFNDDLFARLRTLKKTRDYYFPPISRRWVEPKERWHYDRWCPACLRKLRSDLDVSNHGRNAEGGIVYHYIFTGQHRLLDHQYMKGRASESVTSDMAEDTDFGWEDVSAKSQVLSQNDKILEEACAMLKEFRISLAEPLSFEMLDAESVEGIVNDARRVANDLKNLEQVSSHQKAEHNELLEIVIETAGCALYLRELTLWHRLRSVLEKLLQFRERGHPDHLHLCRFDILAVRCHREQADLDAMEKTLTQTRLNFASLKSEFEDYQTQYTAHALSALELNLEIQAQFARRLLPGVQKDCMTLSEIVDAVALARPYACPYLIDVIEEVATEVLISENRASSKQFCDAFYDFELQGPLVSENNRWLRATYAIDIMMAVANSVYFRSWDRDRLVHSVNHLAKVLRHIATSRTPGTQELFATALVAAHRISRLLNAGSMIATCQDSMLLLLNQPSIGLGSVANDTLHRVFHEIGAKDLQCDQERFKVLEITRSSVSIMNANEPQTDLADSQQALRQLNFRSGKSNKILCPRIEKRFGHYFTWFEILSSESLQHTEARLIENVNFLDSSPKNVPAGVSEIDLSTLSNSWVKARPTLARTTWEILPSEVKKLFKDAIGDRRKEILLSPDPIFPNFPWEALRFGDGDADFLGLHLALPRIGALNAAALSALEPSNILVGEACVVDGSYSSEPFLIKSQDEIAHLRQALSETSTNALIADPIECDINFLLSGLTATKTSGKLLYFKGHGQVVKNNGFLVSHTVENHLPNRALVGRAVLERTQKECDDDGELPELVVLNCCTLGLQSYQGGTAQDIPSVLCSKGSKSVVAHALPVDDALAAALPTALFAEILNGSTIGQAVVDTRRRLFEKVRLSGSSNPWSVWTNMKLFGSPHLSYKFPMKN